jgi:hypothetical protein
MHDVDETCGMCWRMRQGAPPPQPDGAKLWRQHGLTPWDVEHMSAHTSHSKQLSQLATYATARTQNQHMASVYQVYPGLLREAPTALPLDRETREEVLTVWPLRGDMVEASTCLRRQTSASRDACPLATTGAVLAAHTSHSKRAHMH